MMNGQAAERKCSALLHSNTCILECMSAVDCESDEAVQPAVPGGGLTPCQEVRC